MPTQFLRLRQSVAGDLLRVDVEVEDERGQRQNAEVKFKFDLFDFSEQDRADWQWYLEIYLQYPLDPNPQRAARVEARLEEVGEALFKTVFYDDDARDLVKPIRDALGVTRIEITTDVVTANALPWELLRDPKTKTWLALGAQAFVRSTTNATRKAHVPDSAEKLRILLVICRPGAEDDVPFRSVASRIFKNADARQAFEFRVLRPPTFEQLAVTLRAAKNEAAPFHVVHFDGHGAYMENVVNGQAAIHPIDSRLFYGDSPAGFRGYLAFENPLSEDNQRLVDGAELGKILVETAVPMLVLNACRSAHAETDDSDSPSLAEKGLGVRSFGSLAQEVMDAGVAGVVAMRYNVYVVTAAQFVADMYAALAQGRALSEAVSEGRKQLSIQPMREIAFAPIALQDWVVPMVYEAAPIQLLRVGAIHARAIHELPLHELPLRITIDAASQKIDDGLPPAPDAGFLGRDESLLALDRAFDTQSVVLLHAYAGSGKTSCAAEFARWYAETGGTAVVLFTSFETYKPLAQALADVERVFGGVLQQNNINFLALTAEQQKKVALQLFERYPTLWVWDNVEPIAGFPSGDASAWSATEQRALADFLRAARGTRAKFLLTSRRDEQAWLGELPTRVELPPMPLQERFQLARAIAAKFRRTLIEVEDWKPLLYFSQGNPLTLTVLVGQALREGLTARAHILTFVNKLRAGESAFADEAAQGRTKSLGASLSYGFTHAFTEEERKILALLHFFQGFVEVRALWQMGNLKKITGEDYSLHVLHRWALDGGKQIEALLHRAAEVGLLTAHGGGYYTIHPALPWYFRSLYEQYWGKPSAKQLSVNSEQSSEDSTLITDNWSLIPLRAFVLSLGELGNYYHAQYINGNRDVIALLSREEANLLHARALARQHGWWHALASTMQGLHQLYAHTGRRAEWRRLVEEIVPDFVGPNDQPRPGREAQWGLVTEYRMRLAMESRQWAQAERLQHLRVEWERTAAQPALHATNVDDVPSGRHRVRTLAVSVSQLGDILREQGKVECIEAYTEASELYQRNGNRPNEAIAAFNLGHAYKDLPTVRDLAQAEYWYRRSLELRDERDRLGRGKCLTTLGDVTYEHFKETRAHQQPETELGLHFNTALKFYQQALALLPPNAVDDLAVTHNQLGNIYGDVGDFARALPHYQESIRYKEAAGNHYHAATARYNVALTFLRQGRRADARDYAHAALRGFELYGDGAADMIEETKALLRKIEEE